MSVTFAKGFSAAGVAAGISSVGDGSTADADDGDGRCTAVTSTGIRCRNQARPGSRFCGVHEKEGAN